MNLHDLRHLQATMLLKNGVNSKVVSERLGHFDVMFTLKVYSHLDEDLPKEALIVLKNRILMKNKSSQKCAINVQPYK